MNSYSIVLLFPVIIKELTSFVFARPEDIYAHSFIPTALTLWFTMIYVLNSILYAIYSVLYVHSKGTCLQ